MGMLPPSLSLGWADALASLACRQGKGGEFWVTHRSRGGIGTTSDAARGGERRPDMGWWGGEWIEGQRCEDAPCCGCCGVDDNDSWQPHERDDDGWLWADLEEFDD